MTVECYSDCSLRRTSGPVDPSEFEIFAQSLSFLSFFPLLFSLHYAFKGLHTIEQRMSIQDLQIATVSRVVSLISSSFPPSSKIRATRSQTLTDSPYSNDSTPTLMNNSVKTGGTTTISKLVGVGKIVTK